MNRVRLSVLVLMGISVLDLSALAHHSPRANHDPTKIVTIKGTVERVEWRNPHAWLTLSIKKEDGQVESQRIEMGGSAILMTRRLPRELLQPGDLVVIDAWPPTKDEVPPAGRTLTLADGRQFDIADHWGEQQ